MTEYMVEIYRVMNHSTYLFAHISDNLDINGWLYVPFEYDSEYIMSNLSYLWNDKSFTINLRNEDQVEKMYSFKIYINDYNGQISHKGI